MLKFVIGVDKRTSKLGAELERRLRCTYDLSEFDVVGVEGSLSRTSIKTLSDQADCILEALLDFPARIYVAVCMGRVVTYTTHAAIPLPMTVITAITPQGLVLHDVVSPIGIYLPMAGRAGVQHPGPNDLLDVVHDLMVRLVGTQPEPLPHEATLP